MFRNTLHLLFLLLAIITASTIAEQNSVLTIPFVSSIHGAAAISASVISVDDQATTFCLRCPTLPVPSTPGLQAREVLIVGTSTWRMEDSYVQNVTFTADCSTYETTKAVCELSQTGDNFPGTRTETYDEWISVPITVTAGLEKLQVSTKSEQSTVTLPFYNFDEDATISASVLAVNDQATTLAIDCTAPYGCQLAPAGVMVVGTSTYNIAMTDTDYSVFFRTQDCTTYGTASAVCKESETSGTLTGSSTVTYDDGSLVPVTITAGLEKLVAGTPVTTEVIPTATGQSGASVGFPPRAANATSTTMTGGTGSTIEPSATTTPIGGASTEVVCGLMGILAGVAGLLAWIL